jgi:Protein of unknown function (DUF3168)
VAELANTRTIKEARVTPLDLSLEAAIRAAISAALGGRINGIWHDPPLSASPPFVRLSDLITTPWSAKGFDGMEARLTTAILTSGEDRALSADLSAAMEAAILAMPAAIEGARIVLSTPLRRRMVRQGVKARMGGWAALIDWRFLVERM